MDPALQRQKLARLAWIRVGLGAIAGLVAGFLNFVTLDPNVVNPNAYYGVYIGVIVYIASYYLAKYNLVKGINPKDRNKLFTQGIGSFIIMFIFCWIVVSTYHACTTFASCHL
jgi:hypothetical protein